MKIEAETAAKIEVVKGKLGANGLRIGADGLTMTGGLTGGLTGALKKS